MAKMPAHVFQPYFSGERRVSPSLRAWFSAGTYEGAICEDARTMVRWLAARGIATTWRFTREGHSFGTWRHVAPEMLEYFLGVGRGS